ncbi:MAG TPA: PEP/pyruvate-binding domain-containing protein [Anaerolineae bacterium]
MMPTSPVAILAASAYTLPLVSDKATLPLVGGKGANLARLGRAGLPVPGGFLITTQAYLAYLAANELAARIADILSEAQAAGGAFAEAAHSIREAFTHGTMPDALRDEIAAAYAGLDRPPVAVRSSATAEDLPDLSFAGQQDTYLNVVGEPGLLKAVVDCWSSLWTERAIAYRARNAVAQGDVALAVVVQRMVDSEASGVLFTANPLTGLRTETVIDATIGLGEALVSGRVEPDHYVVDVSTGQITARSLGAKTLSIRGQAGGGTAVVAEAAATNQALPDPQILNLASLGRRVADLYDAPQDIEWAWAGDTLYLLQARPITSLYPLPDGMAPDPLMVMFSFGGMQGMLDPVTPIGREMIRQIIVAAARLPGMRLTGQTQRAVLTAGERLWMNVTSLMRNRIGRRIIPGVISFLDPALRPEVAALMNDPRLKPGRQTISRRAVFQLARFLFPLAGNVLLNLSSPDRRRRKIVGCGEQVLDQARARCAGLSGDPKARLAQLAGLIPGFVEQQVPRAFKLFVSGVASGMASFNLLRTLAGSLDRSVSGGAGGSPTWQARALEITLGLPNNPTTEMDLALWQVSQQIRHDPTSRAAFQGRTAAELAAAYEAGTLPDAAQQAFAGFLARYGGRGLAEIDLGRPRWSEDPAHVMGVVEGYLQIGDLAQAPDAVFARRAAAAGVVATEMVAAIRQTRAGWLKSRLLRFAISRTRGLMSLRESPKFMAVRLFAIFRQELLGIGRALAEAGELDRPDDLCFLTFSDLAAYAGGDLADVRDLVAHRREVYRRELQRRQIPRLLLSDGRAYYEGIQAPAAGDGSIAGSPVSPGSAEGTVRVVLDPRHAGLLPGEIMVCPGTDPSWTPLFLTAAALVMEVGGMMTHGAVVAREYGIPAVVGVDRATQRLQTGQRVRVDGSTGQITVLH